LLEVPRQYAIRLVPCRVLFPGQLAKMLTRTAMHACQPCGCAWTGSGAMARVFDRGRGLPILLTPLVPRTARQVAPATGGCRGPSLPPMPVLVWQECRCAAAKGPGTTNRCDGRTWPRAEIPPRR
jgi:hypothetical protein